MNKQYELIIKRTKLIYTVENHSINDNIINLFVHSEDRMKRNTSYNLILGSSSPRRIELLTNVGYDFQVIKSGYHERMLEKASIKKFLVYNTQSKLAKILDDHPHLKVKKNLVLTADTIVTVNSEIIGKPKNKEDASNTLKKLSNSYHSVLTCVNLSSFNEDQILKNQTIIVETKVKFKKLNRDEIIQYVETEEPMDKAGSYAIQGLGSFMVESINGSYTNVMGLPLVETIKLIENIDNNIK